MENVDLPSPTPSNDQPNPEHGEPPCERCGQPLGLESTESNVTRLFTRMQQVAAEQTITIKALREQFIDQEQRNNAVVAHLEKLNSIEKGLSRDAEKAEKKAETEIAILTQELERLESLLTAHRIVFDSPA